MDREHLTHLLTDPSRVQGDDIADLKAMAERFPWFSAAHLLMAVGGHREGDVLFDEQLRVAAAHLPSRSVLFDHIHIAPVEVDLRPTPVPEPAPLSVVRDDVIEAPLEAPVIQPVETSAVLEVVADEPTQLTEQEEVVAESTVASEPQPEPENAVIEPTVGTDPLDELIRSTAVTTSYELLLEHEARKEPSAEPFAEVSASQPAKKVAPAARSFADWLSSAPSADPERSVPTEKPSVENEAAPRREPIRPADPKALEDTKALIDRFIQQHVPPVPKKTEFFTPQQAAKRSLEDHADMVTETLAAIYVKQGNTPKAIAAYQRLAQQHPERSAYYLDKVKELEWR